MTSLPSAQLIKPIVNTRDATDIRRNNPAFFIYPVSCRILKIAGYLAKLKITISSTGNNFSLNFLEALLL
jgi:hypothetical protein